MSISSDILERLLGRCRNERSDSDESSLTDLDPEEERLLQRLHGAFRTRSKVPDVVDSTEGTVPRPKALLKHLKAAVILEQSPAQLEAIIKASPEMLSQINCVFISKSRSNSRITPLIYVITRVKMWPYVSTLLRCGANPNMTSGSEILLDLPLFTAINSYSLAIVEQLLSAGADVAVLNYEGYNVIHRIAMSAPNGVRHDPAALLLLILKHAVKKGVLAPSTIPSASRFVMGNLLFEDNTNSNTQVDGRRLLDLDARLPAVVPKSIKKTALDVFLRSEHPASALVLLMFGANPNCADEELFTPFHTACNMESRGFALLCALFGASGDVETSTDSKTPNAYIATPPVKFAFDQGIAYQKLVNLPIAPVQVVSQSTDSAKTD